MTPATRHEHDNTPAAVLCMAFALSEKTWQLGFSMGHGQKPRERMLPARDQKRLLDDIAQANVRFGLPDTAPVVRCDDAGREGFWLHRFLQAQGITTHGVDSSSLEVNRRQRRAKSEALDVRKLLRMLRRYHYGERQVWRVVHGPSVAAEEPRHLPRDLETLKQARASPTNRIKGLLSRQGGRLASVHTLPAQRDARRLGEGSPVPRGLRRRVLRVYAPSEFLGQQLAALEADRRALLRSAQEAHIEQGRQLIQLQGIGLNGAWLLVREFFGGRELKTRRAVGGCAG